MYGWRGGGEVQGYGVVDKWKIEGEEWVANVKGKKVGGVVDHQRLVWCVLENWTLMW